MHSRPWLTVLVLTGLAVPVALAPARAQISADSLDVTGFVESSFQYSTAAQNRIIVGSLYGRHDSQFSLNAFAIGVDRSISPQRTMAGFTVRMMYGASATSIHAAGLDIGPQADLTQAFVTFNRPTTHGSVQVSAGKLSSLMGLEVIESVLNPNLSAGNQFIFVEDFTHVGLDVNWNVNSAWAVRAALVNGWDVAVDNNNGKSLMARVAWTGEGSSVAVCGYAGPERSDSEDLRRGGEVLATIPIGPMSATVQFDAGAEDGIDASWWAAGAWWTIPAGGLGKLALRGDVLDDTDGARTSGVLGYPALDAHRLASLTATLNMRPAANMMVRPEIRYDRSSRAVYDGEREQVTFAIGGSVDF